MTLQSYAFSQHQVKRDGLGSLGPRGIPDRVKHAANILDHVGGPPIPSGKSKSQIKGGAPFFRVLCGRVGGDNAHSRLSIFQSRQQAPHAVGRPTHSYSNPKSHLKVGAPPFPRSVRKGGRRQRLFPTTFGCTVHTRHPGAPNPDPPRPRRFLSLTPSFTIG
jgi:hypothetical protein